MARLQLQIVRGSGSGTKARTRPESSVYLTWSASICTMVPSPTKVAAPGSSWAFVSWNGLSTTFHTRPSHAMYPTPQWPKSTATLAEFVLLGPPSTTAELSVVEPVDEDDEPSVVAVEACTTPARELSRHPLRGLNNSGNSSAIRPLAVPSLAVNATRADCPVRRAGASPSSGGLVSATWPSGPARELGERENC